MLVVSCPFLRVGGSAALQVAPPHEAGQLRLSELVRTARTSRDGQPQRPRRGPPGVYSLCSESGVSSFLDESKDEGEDGSNFCRREPARVSGPPNHVAPEMVFAHTVGHLLHRQLKRPLVRV